MAKKKRDVNKIIIYTVVIIVTIATVLLYTPIFWVRKSKPKPRKFIPPTGTPFSKGPSVPPPNELETSSSLPIVVPTPNSKRIENRK